MKTIVKVYNFKSFPDFIIIRYHIQNYITDYSEFDVFRSDDFEKMYIAYTLHDAKEWIAGCYK